MAPWLFRILLIGVVLYALWRGGRDERAVAIMCVIATLATMLVISPLVERFHQVELGVLLIDLALFAGFTVVAMRSSRFWPLWVAGLQLTTMLGHSLKGFGGDLVPQAYGAALNFWSYPIILILGIGTWRTHQRWLDRSRNDDGARFT